MRIARRTMLRGVAAGAVLPSACPLQGHAAQRRHGKVVTMPPDEFARYVAREIERYRVLLPSLGIQMD